MRVQRQLVQEMFGPVVEQDRDAMAVSIAGSAVAPAEPLDLAAGVGEGHLVAVGVLGPVRAGGTARNSRAA